MVFNQRSITKINEVNWFYHKIEFDRFYVSHQKLCRQILGISYFEFYNEKDLKSEKLTATKLNESIKLLSAFVVDNIHYVKDELERSKLETDLDELEVQIIVDQVYSRLAEKIEKSNSVSIDELIQFNQIYFTYINKLFDIFDRLLFFLQGSLMISPSSILKSVDYSNFEQFFVKLSEYRVNMSSNLARFKFTETLDLYKRTLAYYWTYRVLVNTHQKKKVDFILGKLIELILNSDNIKLILSEKNNGTQSKEYQVKILKYSKIIKDSLRLIYSMVNSNLESKNILPKSRIKINRDTTSV